MWIISGRKVLSFIENRLHLAQVFAAAFLGMILVSTFLRVEIVHACTIGAGMGDATVDGCPFAWKNRDDSSRPIHYLIFRDNGPYSYIAIGPNSTDAKMGVNDQGLALSNSLVTNERFDDWEYSNNQAFKDYVLANCTDISDVRRAILEVTSGTASNWPQPLLLIAAFSDAQGNADVFELVGSNAYEYDPANTARIAAYPWQFVVRDNNAHQQTDQLDDSHGGRYLMAKDLMDDFAANGGIAMANVFSTSRNGQAGSANEINNNTTIAALVSHGVLPADDPRIVTLWAALGNPAFTVFLPHWVAVGDSLSSRVSVTSSNDPSSTIGWASEVLFEKKGSDTTYGQYVHRLLAPLEVNFLEMEILARRNWVQNGFQTSEATRIQQAAAETTYQTMVVMGQGTGRDLEAPPTISSIVTTAKDTAMQLSCEAQDSDGTIALTEWDFGDGFTDTGTTVSHQYSGTGPFLVFCRVTDNAGAQNLRAIYVGASQGVPRAPSNLRVQCRH